MCIWFKYGFIGWTTFFFFLSYKSLLNVWDLISLIYNQPDVFFYLWWINVCCVYMNVNYSVSFQSKLHPLSFFFFFSSSLNNFTILKIYNIVIQLSKLSHLVQLFIKRKMECHFYCIILVFKVLFTFFFF